MKDILASRLDEERGYGSDVSAEENEDERDEDEVVLPEGIGAGATAPDDTPRRGESTQRHR